MLDIFKNPANKVVHIIGISGIGMSAIAKLMYDYGFKVQGSDIKENLSLPAKIKFFLGHSKDNIKNVNYIIHSSAIKEDNIQIQTAKENNIKIISRPEILKMISQRYKTVIAITGSHGKTTTTAMVSNLLSILKPTVICGGIMKNVNNNIIISQNRNLLIIEADESDNALNYIKHDIVIITNCNPEHLDFHKTFQNLCIKMNEFISNTSQKIFMHQSLYNKLHKNNKCEFYDLMKNTNSIYTKNIKHKNSIDCNTEFRYCSQDIEIDIKTEIAGEHNILNMLSAIAVAKYLKINDTEIKKQALDFKGVQRRMDFLYKQNDIAVISDYAHCPGEIMSTITALKNITKDSNTKIIAVIQIHKVSRLLDTKEDFQKILSTLNIHQIILTPIYEPPRYNTQTPIPRIEEILNFDSLQNILFLEENKKILPTIKKILFKKKKYFIIFLGAGDIVEYANKFVKCLEEENGNKQK